jgi:hypothetical protein
MKFMIRFSCLWIFSIFVFLVSNLDWLNASFGGGGLAKETGAGALLRSLAVSVLGGAIISGVIVVAGRFWPR